MDLVPQVRQKRFGILTDEGVASNQPLMFKGREPCGLSLHEAGRGEGGVPVLNQCLQQGMTRVSGLEEDGSRFFLSSRPTSDLDNQLRGFFSRTKIGAVKAGIHIQNAHQGDARKVMALGNHLSSDQKIDASSVHGIKNAVKGAFVSGAVPVDSSNALIAKKGF